MTIFGGEVGGFLGGLSDSLLGSVGLAENTPASLDGRVAGDFAKLGQFADQIDKSAQRSYVEDGTVRNIRPRALEIIMQQPDLTVVVKKRAFSSLAENYRINLLDEKEKLFIRATKRLFQNKLRAIANYERLSKLERLAVKNDGIISDFALPAIFGALDGLDAVAPNLIGQKPRSVLETIRRVKTLSDPSFLSSWIVDSTIPFASDTGEGTGVFELTNVQNMTAKNSVEFGGGTASLGIEDPYKLMVVSNEDIDRAIIEANNQFNRNNFFIFSEFQLEKTLDQLKVRLLSIRRARGAADIRFSVNEDTALFKKVRAIVQDSLLEVPPRDKSTPEPGSKPGRLIPEIQFTFNAGILGANLFSFDNSAVEIDPAYFVDRAGINGISRRNDEADIFKQIIQNTYTWIAQKTSKRAGNKEFNRETNVVRRQMMLHYGGKPIIQPMDVVSVFVSTKTIIDSKVTQGLKTNFAADSRLNQLNDTIANIESAVEDIKGAFGDSSGGSNFFENEKNIIAGPDFPGWLWLQLRNDFTRQAAGVCVFHGLVSSATHNYSGGKYVLNVSCQDNSHYFKMGRTNINPSAEVFNGALYDPLTPFDLDFDASSGFSRGTVPRLLDENVRLLVTGSVKAKAGRSRGRNVDEKTYTRKEIEIMAGVGPDSRQGLFRNKFYDPDGMVYRWKQGIGSLVALGEPHSDVVLGGFRGEHSPNLTKSPFAGQDVMNVLSLLITGQPYNYNTFMRGALNAGKLNKDDLFNNSSSTSFFRGLISDITKNNGIWGSFIPFKKLIINERGFNFLATGEHDLITRNARLSQLLRERAETFDGLTTIVPDLANTPQFYKADLGGKINTQVDQRSQSDAIQLAKRIRELDEQIEQERVNFKQRMQDQTPATRGTDGVIRIFGDDISFDPSATDANSVTENERIREREEFRKKIGYLTQRRLWRVKANEDHNLFIVDDSYDKNYDIQAFERKLAGKIELFQSTWTNIFDQIERVAVLLGLEVFANSQGHIEVRPPQYNRMPSSVFHRLLQERAEKGIQIFPPYLESLFFNKLGGISQQIEIIEDKIRVRAAVLGRKNDEKAREILGPEFNFLTTEKGNFGSIDMRELFRQNAPDLVEENAAGPLEDLSDLLSGPLNSKINFDAVNRAATIVNPTSFGGSGANKSRIEIINSRLREKTGQIQPSARQLLSSDRHVGTGDSQVAVLNVTEQISRLVAERQNLIRSMANATRNLREGLSLNTQRGGKGDIVSILSGEGSFGGSSGSADSILNPQLNQKKDKIFPEIVAHMIEDEDFDDLGIKSGQRFILDDSKIITLTINETPPPHTVVQVDGALENALVPLPGGLQLGSTAGEGGNAIGTAFAVDYDMWRLYGFRGANAVNMPFFSDPRAQCAPYAVFLLNLARKNIFQGTADVIGNEFIQAGEVYYIEDRDLLFYANSVTHSFTYNGEYKTSIELTYGHNPGEYIPTHLDIIGKGLYANRHQADIVRHVRHGRLDGTTPLSVLVHDITVAPLFGKESVTSLVDGIYGDINRKNLGNILLATTGLLTPTDFGKVANIEIRVYKNSNLNILSSTALQKIAFSIKAWLINPSLLSSDGENVLPDINVENIKVDPKRVKVVTIDLDATNDEEVRSPSSEAWSQARSIASVGPGAQTASSVSASAEVAANEGSQAQADALNASADVILARAELKALINSVIDIWVNFTNAEQVNESKPEDADAPNQKLQTNLVKLQDDLQEAFDIEDILEGI